VNFFTRDTALGDALRPYADLSDDPELQRIGETAGSEEALSQALPANQNPPVLRTHDRYGNRIDEVEFHPSWHWLMEKAVGFGLQAAPWISDRPSPHLTRAAGFYLWSQVEPGHGCPISMTYAAVPALKADERLAKEWIPQLASTQYDVRRLPAAAKYGVLAGMGMTEKQGGSDVRANLTTATPTGSDGEYQLNGHKWFCSAPQVDVFLVLAQAPEGLSCFVVPRVLADGNRNAFALQRLKDKLGNRSNASSEVEFHGTVGYRLGDEGAGVRTIIEMVAATRLDCVLGSAALQRRALVEAIWHTSHRSAFGGLLKDKPAMQNVLADLALESEAATALGMRLAAAVDASLQGDEQAAAFRRIALPSAKFWVCKRTPMMVAEALESLGGNGYVEESGVPLHCSSGNPRSTRSGKAPATSTPSTSCEPYAGRSRWTPGYSRSAPRGVPMNGSMPRSTMFWKRLPTSPRRRPARGGWRPGWPCACRRRCLSATRRPRSRMRSWRPGWRMTGVASSALFRGRRRSRQSSTAASDRRT